MNEQGAFRLCLKNKTHTQLCSFHSVYSLKINVPLLFLGKTRSVRRSLFAQSSGLGSGVYWEWANDEGGWTPYETRTSILLEHSYQARQGTADLGPHGYNYIVDLTSLAQVNKSTGFRRQVRRQCNLPYPLASSGPPAIPSGPACSCQQCLSHSSTGPMPSRSRHSFSSGSLNRPSLQGTGRAVAAHPTSVYSPYPRRPLSVGGMSWGSPWAPPTSGSQLSASLTNSTSANGLRLVSDTYPILNCVVWLDVQGSCYKVLYLLSSSSSLSFLPLSVLTFLVKQERREKKKQICSSSTSLVCLLWLTSCDSCLCHH